MAVDTRAMPAPAELRERARELFPRVVAWRRDLHRHPELGFEEVRTAGIVAGHLASLDVEVRRVAGTGVVGILHGVAANASSGPTIALRADMDALPVPEQTGAPYASGIPGKMHACGHDAHTANLMGVAEILAGWRDRLPGNVKFFFQPAEEGPGGARPMIEEGCMEDPRVDAVVGLHVNVELPPGRIGLRTGVGSAATDGFSLKILGAGGHGAAPHKALDTIPVAAQVVTALQHVVSRQTSPLDPVVITIGTIRGGYRHNVIADQTELTATVRTMDPATRAAMQERIERLVRGTCEAHGARYELAYTYGYPSVVNDPGLTELVARSARELLGDDGVQTVAATMGGEDFAYFAERAPGCFFRLGCGNPERGLVFPGHHPRFDIDEEGLLHGMTVMVRTVFNFLGGAGSR